MATPCMASSPHNWIDHRPETWDSLFVKVMRLYRLSICPFFPFWPVSCIARRASEPVAAVASITAEAERAGDLCCLQKEGIGLCE